ncbi:hypothetical protein DPMN_129622 [Dreissena polymorpha]|uniref:Uncharacterized protein n=1 Tax=Dreissena polymorpha TaxID=45954 RepID=A0A9D4H3I8_DREPO|nr:hypothetical protein DPMN_129622 [Dreissena polymorpha]
MESSTILENMARLFEIITMQLSSDSDSLEAVEFLANFYGTVKKAQLVHGYLLHGVHETETVISP